MVTACSGGQQRRDGLNGAARFCLTTCTTMKIKRWGNHGSPYLEPSLRRTTAGHSGLDKRGLTMEAGDSIISVVGGSIQILIHVCRIYSIIKNGRCSSGSDESVALFLSDRHALF